MYSARISRSNPILFVILIDQSGSMEELTRFNGKLIPKSEAVAMTVNILISELLYRSRREEGYRDYFEIAVLGYHGQQVVPMVGDAGHLFMRPSELAASELGRVKLEKERRLPDGRTMISVVDQRVWIRPYAGDKTPMYAALLKAYEEVKRWCQQKNHHNSYPPVIFNITDGEASDGNEAMLMELSEQIKGLSTGDGHVLLMNMHISSDQTTRPVIFAASEAELPDQRYARLLYQMSSPMPAVYHENIRRVRGIPGGEAFRGMCYTAAMTGLFRMMNIGSVSVNLMDN